MLGCLWATDFPGSPQQDCPSGMLPHKLTLKEGAPVMLLRNMHGARGQANGTRMLIRKIRSRVIEAEIVTGCIIGKVGIIP